MQRVRRIGKRSCKSRQSGFTLIQMIIVVAIISVLSTFGFLGITSARAEMRKQNSARRLAIYAEKARVDSVRRHAAPGNEASVGTSVVNANTFAVAMDFGSGFVEIRTFTLDDGVFITTDPQTATFDWRGRIAKKVVFQVSNGQGEDIPVDISGSGDVTIGSQIFADDAIPAIALATPVTNDIVPDPTPFPTATPIPIPDPNATPLPTPTPTPNGNGNGNGNGVGNENPHGNPAPSPTPTAAPTPTADPTPTPDASPTPVPPCLASVSTDTITLSQSVVAHRSGTVTFSLTNAIGARTISASGNSLDFSVSPTSLTGNGSAVITITSRHGGGNRGIFTVTISASPSCGSAQTVKVTVLN